jgi:membrane protein required for beta-lactamase induction
MEAEVTAADLLVLAPWLIFGAGIAAICYRLLARRRASRRHHRDSR